MEHLENKLNASIIEAMRSAEITNEAFEFFWETNSPFSQWHRCSFHSKLLFPIAGFDEELSFSSAEQFMMVHKALLFNDVETAKKIMMTRNVREQKSFGRQVSAFNAAEWDRAKVMVVHEGNKSKFQQNLDLHRVLLATKGKTLVEAAPDDTVWGIGLLRTDPRAQKRETWLGTNFLGHVLTALRIELTGTY
jgi:ribA/ribD-fused uncharacterized protein